MDTAYQLGVAQRRLEGGCISITKAAVKHIVLKAALEYKQSVLTNDNFN